MQKSSMVGNFNPLERLISSITILAIVAWSLNPFACCPREAQYCKSCVLTPMCQPAEMALSTDSTAKADCSQSLLLKPDSQLGKTITAGTSCLGHSVTPCAFSVPELYNWQAITLDEQLEPESVFSSLIRKPPRV
jgi:hypothetical protein